MMNRRIILALAAATSLSLIVPALASERVAFDTAAFEKAKAEGKPILVHITAPWCETCQKQKPIVADLMKSPELASLEWFEVDFDTQKDVRRSLNVQRQSTMIVYKDGKEVDRAVGRTSRKAIHDLLAKAL